MNRTKTNNQHDLDSRHKRIYYPLKKSSLKQNQVESLKLINAQLVEKEQILIQKLMKLQQGLEKQHQLYQQLFEGYKRKEQEINNLQQLYRQTQRKKSQSVHPDYHHQYQSNNKIVKECLDKLQKEHSQLILAYQNLKIQQSKLISEITYLRNKEKMNDSKASLQSKALEQLSEWQKKINQEKEQKIKLLCQNSFLRQRNKDLQKTRKQLEKVLQFKQKQILKLRQQKIMTTRQISESRMSRSISPKNNSTNCNSLKPSNQLLKLLQKQNKNLETSIKHMRQNQQAKQMHSYHSNLYHEFFSFSGDDKNEMETCQSNSLYNTTERKMRQENLNSIIQDLPNFPHLQIQAIIENKQKTLS